MTQMVNRWTRARLSRLSINTQLSLWLFILGVGLALVALLLWIDAGEQAARLAQREIDMALNASSSDLTEQSGDLATLGKWLVREPSLATMILERDKTALTRLVEPLTKTASPKYDHGSRPQRYCAVARQPGTRGDRGG